MRCLCPGLCFGAAPQTWVSPQKSAPVAEAHTVTALMESNSSAYCSGGTVDVSTFILWHRFGSMPRVGLVASKGKHQGPKLVAVLGYSCTNLCWGPPGAGEPGAAVALSAKGSEQAVGLQLHHNACMALPRCVHAPSAGSCSRSSLLKRNGLCTAVAPLPRTACHLHSGSVVMSALSRGFLLGSGRLRKGAMLPSGHEAEAQRCSCSHRAKRARLSSAGGEGNGIGCG